MFSSFFLSVIYPYNSLSPPIGDHISKPQHSTTANNRISGPKTGLYRSTTYPSEKQPTRTKPTDTYPSSAGYGFPKPGGPRPRDQLQIHRPRVWVLKMEGNLTRSKTPLAPRSPKMSLPQALMPSSAATSLMCRMSSESAGGYWRCSSCE